LLWKEDVVEFDKPDTKRTQSLIKNDFKV